MAEQQSQQLPTIVWLHGDNLNPYGPALTAYPGAPAIFVWDDALLEEWGITLKRVAFIYECLLELPVTIRRGDVAAEVVAFAREHGATQVATAESPSPRFGTILAEIERSLVVEELPEADFARYPGKLDLTRFSRYWNKVQPSVFGRGPLGE